MNPGFVYHSGDICNLGILCGAAPGQPSDRSLLDFTSVALDSHGCELFTFAGNPQGDSKGTFNFVTRQLTGCFGAKTTHKKKHHKHKHKKHHPAPKHHHSGGEGN